MKNIHDLINKIAWEEKQLQNNQFLAPCVQGGKVRTKVAGMIYTFIPNPRNFEGWGIFQAVNDKNAKVIAEADLPQISEYLQHFPQVRLWLAYALKQQTWLAYPINEADMKQRTGQIKPIPVYLVNDGANFDPIVARWDGFSFWFEEVDRRADPMPTEYLREGLNKLLSPAEIRFKGMTPEMHTVYQLAVSQTKEFQAKIQQVSDEKRLQNALKMGGGELQSFRDRQDHWIIEWTTAEGDRHTSAISKKDLTVISAGICLSGFDRHFDLQSLVGVVENQ